MTINFPDRDYLKFDQLKARWKCEEDDLINLLVTAELRPSIKAFRDWKVVGWECHDGEAELLPTGDVYDGQTGDEIFDRPTGWCYLQMPHQTGLLKANFELVTEEREPVIPSHEGFGEAKWYRLQKPMSLEDVKSDAVFLFEEVLRIEAKLMRSPKDQKEKPGLSTRERNNLLTLIGGLVGLMLGKSPSGKKNSIFQDQIAISAALIAHYPNVEGFGESTLEQKFAEANKRIATFSENPK